MFFNKINKKENKYACLLFPLPAREIDGLKGFLEEHAQAFSLRIASEEDIHQNKNRSVRRMNDDT